MTAETAMLPAPLITADMVLAMMAADDGVISVDEDGTPRAETVRSASGGSLCREHAATGCDLARDVVSCRTVAFAWNGHRPFTRGDAARYAEFLTGLL